MSIEVIIIIVLIGITLFLGGYIMGKKSETIHNLEERLEKLEAAQDKPIGYNQMAAFDELTAYLVGIEKRCEIAREYANAAKRGKYRAQDDD